MAKRTRYTDPPCHGCGTKMPDWPRGWLTTDDGLAYCPTCRLAIRPITRKPA